MAEVDGKWDKKKAPLRGSEVAVSFVICCLELFDKRFTATYDSNFALGLVFGNAP
jgi:hypothetical protein